MSVSFTFKGVMQQLELVVDRTDTPALLSRIWMAAFSELQTWLRNAPEVNSIAFKNIHQVRISLKLV